MDNYVDGHFIETCAHVCHHNRYTYIGNILPLSLVDEGEFVGVVTSVGWSVRPAAVGEVDDLNCLDDCKMHT